MRAAAKAQRAQPETPGQREGLARDRHDGRRQDRAIGLSKEETLEGSDAATVLGDLETSGHLEREPGSVDQRWAIGGWQPEHDRRRQKGAKVGEVEALVPRDRRDSLGANRLAGA